MTFKQFLKPDWRKTVLAIIFIILPIYAWFTDETSYAIGILWILGAFLVLPSAVVLSLLYKIGIDSTNEIKIITIFLVSSIIYYLFSCLIFWIYDKVKKKKST